MTKKEREREGGDEDGGKKEQEKAKQAGGGDGGGCDGRGARAGDAVPKWLCVCMYLCGMVVKERHGIYMKNKWTSRR